MQQLTQIFTPNFELECHVCGTMPTVDIALHMTPNTQLCGSCFFQDRRMKNHELWNDPPADFSYPST